MEDSKSASVEKRVGSRPSRRVAVTYSLPLDGGRVGVGVADRHAAKPGSVVTSRRCSPSPSPLPSREGGFHFFLPSLFTHLKFNRAVNQELECMLQDNEDEKLAMRAIGDFDQPKNRPPLEAFQLFEVSIPSLANTPWKDVVRIRRQGRFDSLRDRLVRILQSVTSDLTGC